jgi:antitoxin ParD1/3/4
MCLSGSVKMTQLTITLPESAKAFIDEQIANGSYSSADVLLADLIAQAQERQAKLQVNSLLRSTLQQNKAIPKLLALGLTREQVAEALGRTSCLFLITQGQFARSTADRGAPSIDGWRRLMANSIPPYSRYVI